MEWSEGSETLLTTGFCIRRPLARVHALGQDFIHASEQSGNCLLHFLPHIL